MKATTLAEIIPRRLVRVAVDDDRGPVGILRMVEMAKDSAAEMGQPKYF